MTGADAAPLELVSALARARGADEAARAMVEWLQSRGDRQWWVLAVASEDSAAIVAGPGVGRVVALVADEEQAFAAARLGADLPGDVLLVPVTTRFGTWGAVAASAGDASMVRTAGAALAAVLEALQQEAELHDAIDRLEEAQSVAHMGSYDWEITTDVNRWSDELYRIYGHEPQSFNASYERFQSMMHPDDRERVQAMHQQAYATGEPYHTVERIVRPDGEVRVLDTTGRVIQDATGTPVRMAGVCIDITDRWRTEQQAARVAERFLLLVETAPDALVVVDRDGIVTQVNQRALALFGTTTEALVGSPVSSLLPGGLPSTGPDGMPQEQRDLRARRADGSTFPADVTAGVIEDDDETVVVAFVRDATRRIEEEQQRQEAREADLRRRQALEINDNVLQGLAATLYTMEQGDHRAAMHTARATLASARGMVDELMSRPGGDVAPGALVRDQPAPRTSPEPPRDDSRGDLDHIPAPAASEPTAPVRVVVVDDAEDLRLLFTVTLEATGDFAVVATAGDGRTAIDVCERWQPDLVLLDLSMPVMDGLEALPHLRSVAPDATVVVLSGFDARSLEPQVLGLGAAAYLEKGLPQRDLVARLRALTGKAAATPPPPVQDDGPGDEVDALIDHLVHELTTPLTAVEGLTETLRERGDQLPSATTAELLASLHRNVHMLSELTRRVAQARQVTSGHVVTDPQPVDVEGIVRETVRDFAGIAGGGRLVLQTADTPGLGTPGRGTATVEADVVHLRQIVTNLFSNALKFSQDDQPVTVTVLPGDEEIVVDVADHGAGIPAGIRRDVFDRFVRGASHVPGLGLGLYLARTLARANGGDVTLVESDPSGSTFRLSLPAAGSHARELARPRRGTG